MSVRLGTKIEEIHFVSLNAKDHSEELRTTSQILNEVVQRLHKHSGINWVRQPRVGQHLPSECSIHTNASSRSKTGR